MLRIGHRNLLGAIVSVGLTTAAVAVLTQPAHAQQSGSSNNNIPAQVVNSAVQSAVQAAIQNAIDRIFDQRRRAAAAGRPLGFAGDPDYREYDDIFNALGYSGKAKAVYTKAPEPATARPSLTTALWGSGTGSYERVSSWGGGMLSTSSTSAITGLGGVDFTESNIGPNLAAVLVGALGGDTSARTSATLGVETKTTAPTAGGYLAYVVGDFSTDFSFTTNFIHSDTTGPAPASMLQTNYNYALDLNYRFGSETWFEPTGGATYTKGVWGGAQKAMGFQDNDTVRLQAGARAGTSIPTAYGIKLEPVLMGLVYSDVYFSGTAAPVAAAALPGTASNGDLGRLWEKADLKLNAIITQNFSAYIEGEIHHCSCGQNGGPTIGGTSYDTGYSGTLGLRYSW